jgi:hypothetical protein
VRRSRERIALRAAEIDAPHEFPVDVVELYRDRSSASSSARTGGTGTGALLSLVAIEEVSSLCDERPDLTRSWARWG